MTNEQLMKRLQVGSSNLNDANDLHALCYGRIGKMQLQHVTLASALMTVRDRLKDHPAYADLTLKQEEEIGGDTAELSYLVRVCNAAIYAAGLVPLPCVTDDIQEGLAESHVVCPGVIAAVCPACGDGTKSPCDHSDCPSGRYRGAP